MKRREFIGVLGSAAAWSLVARAEDKLTRIGYLALTSPTANPEPLIAFREGMRERGYIEGQNLLIEYRWAEQPSEAVATELVRFNVDVIVAWGTPAVAAAKRATSTIPIVFVSVADPVRSGLVASLARPGGNVTGVTNIASDLSKKLVEILVEVIPGVNRIAVLRNPNNPTHSFLLRETEAGSRALGLTLQVVDVAVPEDLEGAFAQMTRASAQGMVALAEPLYLSERRRIL